MNWIRYFSGRARYSTTFVQPYSPEFRPSRFTLDAGVVADAATVWINGKKAGTLWQSPFVVDLTGFVREGINVLSIEVANNWPNRMIGDAKARRENPAAEKMVSDGRWFPEAARSIFAPPERARYPEWVVADLADSGSGIFTWSNYDDAWGADEPLKPAGLLGPVRILRMEKGSTKAQRKTTWKR